jgi:dienelactone hydrolase
MNLIRPMLLAFVAAAASSAAVAQAPFLVGIRDVSLPNTSGQGSANLTARVHYPAAVAGTNAAVLPRAGGWPVVVFLHGFAAVGNNYAPVGNALASNGFVAVMSNTTQFDNQGQEYDGRALYAALVAANGSAASPLFGALDMSNAGLLGHSMGGGNVGNVLANNPGYRAGFCMAPVPPRGSNASNVRVPLGIVAGQGDSITPVASNAQPYYQALANYSAAKSYYLMNGDCTHLNVCAFSLASATDNAVFARSMAITLGWFDRFLRNGPLSLDAVFGPAPRGDARLVSASQQFVEPQVFASGLFAVGQTTRVSVAAEAGFCGIGLGSSLASAQPTPFGDLLLDAQTAALQWSGFTGSGASSQRLDVAVAVPLDPAFAGLPFAVQALGADRTGALRLGNALAFTIAQ